MQPSTFKPKFGGAPSCVKCQKSVYAAEQIAGPGGFFHKACFCCKECNKRLDSVNVTERNNEAYCKTCYGKLFGPKGYGFAGLNMDTTITNEQKFFNSGSQDNISNSSVPAVPTAAVPRDGPMPLQNTFFQGGSQDKIVLAPSSPPSTTSPFQPSAQTTTAMFEAKAKFNSAAAMAGGCPRCGKQVYFAEQVLGPAGVKYHKLCFRCSDCGKSLDSTTMTEKESVLFCKTCYNKKWGPKGFGYGVGAGTLYNTQ
ncbi:hypothetical protein HDU99_000581 [Rhizoclosmatium hyalinum]|nr:hypothetical protein HDU99_000581 [Rhizoclosmatium hyalinum]